ncbi:unnamed protein product [Schistosoma turkestanicum]|nr:unnamed protein product [Schistosoma turkestanicum]
MSFKTTLKSNYGNPNHSIETQTKIIHFFNTYKQLLDGYTRQIVNKLHNNTSMNNSITNCNSKTNNHMNYNSFQTIQAITNSKLNTLCSFKSPTINSYNNLTYKPYSSTSNPINSTIKPPFLNEFCLKTNDTQHKSSDFIKAYSQTLSSFPLSNCNYFKTKHYPSSNLCPKLPISGVMDGRVLQKIQPSSSSTMSLPTKLSTSALTTSTNTTTTSSSNSSSPSLSVDSMDITTNISKYLTVQKILKRLAKLPNNLGPYICRLCNQHFENALKLANHRCPLILHTDYRCPECDKVFSCPANLASHRRWHKPKSEIDCGQVPVGNHSSFPTSTNHKCLAEKKYYNYNAKDLATNSKLFNRRVHLNKLSKSEFNSIVLHQKQTNQYDQCVFNSNSIKKPTFTVQAILEDSCNNNDQIQNTITKNNNLPLNYDETIITNESSRLISYTESTEVDLNFQTNNSSNTNNNDVNNFITTISSNNMYSGKQCLINAQNSLQCNYCNTSLSTRSELETHMIEHIFNRLKSSRMNSLNIK